METVKTFQSSHTDVIHDIAYDYHGKRVATSSADGTIKIWENDIDEWRCIFTIKASAHAVYKSSWASPESGPYLVCCVADRAIHVFEEYTTASGPSSWRRVASITSLPDICVAVEFAPSSLRFAAALADGTVRLYNADSTSYVVGSRGLPAEASMTWTQEAEVSLDSGACSSISWNKCPFDPPMLVVGAGNSAHVVEYADRVDRWVLVCSLLSHTAAVTSVSWAPATGRTAHIIATGCRDGCVRAHWYYTRGEPTATEGALGGGVYGNGTPSSRVQSALTVGSPVSDLSFDVTGSMLVCSDENGQVHSWRQDFTGILR